MRKSGTILAVVAAAFALVAASFFYPAVDLYNSATSTAVKPDLPPEGSIWRAKVSFLIAADEDSLKQTLPPLYTEGVERALAEEGSLVRIKPGDEIEALDSLDPGFGMSTTRVRFGGREWFAHTMHFSLFYAERIDAAE